MVECGGNSHFEVSGASLEEISDGVGLRFRERAGAPVNLPARIFAGSQATPSIAEVPVKIDTGAKTAHRTFPVLSP